MAAAVVLSSCGNTDFDTAQWFAKPLNVFDSNRGYSYSQLGEAKHERPITANDLVDANGACPVPAAPAQPQPAPVSAGGSPALTPDPGSVLGGGVAIGMTECEVLARVGQASAVNLGKTLRGDRSAVLTVSGGPRPGVYRFEGGRLTEMDRVPEPPPSPPTAKQKMAKKKPASKKPVESKNPQKTNDKS